MTFLVAPWKPVASIVMLEPEKVPFTVTASSAWTTTFVNPSMEPTVASPLNLSVLLLLLPAEIAPETVAPSPMVTSAAPVTVERAVETVMFVTVAPLFTVRSAPAIGSAGIALYSSGMPPPYRVPMVPLFTTVWKPLA